MTRSGTRPRPAITQASTAALAALATAVTLGGCTSAASEPGVGHGTQVALDQIQAIDLKLVTEAADEPARILGTVINTGTTPVEVVSRDADDTATLTIGAEDTFRFADNPTIFSTTDADIGDTAAMLISVPVIASEEAVAVPVYQGDLGGYYDRTS
ncbi:hypothetical protein [Arthrobacter sp. TMS2-4]